MKTKMMALCVVTLGVMALTGTWVVTQHKAQPQLSNPCASHSGIPTGFPSQRHAGMVRLPGGSITPGTVQGYPDERPVQTIAIKPFWIDRTEVTNAQFAAFVAATNYKTEAEREGGAAVFRAPPAGSPPHASWWHYVQGASWQHPEGPGSNLNNRGNHPVVQVTQADALAYAHWLGRDLPTEAEWEWAARGNGAPEALTREPRASDGSPTANFWQGVFPDVNTLEDGYGHRAPVGCFPANGWGLSDMIGNVWEWTMDPYLGPHRYQPANPEAYFRRTRPTARAGSYQVIKGGSFLCAASYCSRYRSSARHGHENNLPTSHIGFRTVLRSE